MTQDNPYKRDPPGWYYFIATILLALAAYCYYYFTTFEKEGGVRKINWIVAMAYEFGGKWMVIGFLFLMSIFCIYLGIDEMNKRKLQENVK